MKITGRIVSGNQADSHFPARPLSLQAAIGGFPDKERVEWKGAVSKTGPDT